MNISAVVKSLLNGLEPRERAILQGRFGLLSGDGVTLAKLGTDYGITRERVRQIEGLALDAVSGAKGDDFKMFIELVRNYLANVGGVKREDLLLNDLRALMKTSEAKSIDNQLRFLLKAAGTFRFSKETPASHPFWYLGEEARKQSAVFVKDLLSELKEKKSDVLERQNFGAIFSGVARKHNLKEAVAMNYAAISRKFVANAYGDFGLSHWGEVNPKTARDWAHLVLRKEKKPLHFTEIAKVINGLRKDKQIHYQTVHNELIKDDKFVLVGKGMYGLREFGLIPGTAREVIGHLIKKHGPMKAPDVIERILSERFLKPNTILINLQNKKHFVRLDDGRYTIREA